MIADYSSLKAFLVNYAKGDPRLREVLWGEDKRAHDAQAGRSVSPYFWVADCRMIGRELSGGLAAIYWWQLDISIKMATPRQYVMQQELAMNQTFKIATDFLKYLQSEANASRIEFRLDDAAVSPAENYEQDSYYGWDITLRIGEVQSCYKFNPAIGRYAVCAQRPAWGGASGNLAISINETVFTQAWDKEINAPIILYRLVKDINASGGNYTAETDGTYLYVRSTAVTLPITIADPETNAHSWTDSQCLPGQAGSASTGGIGEWEIGSTFIIQ